MSGAVKKEEETQKSQSDIETLTYKLKKLDKDIATEQKRQKSRLDDEHEMWAPLIMDARSRLGTSASPEVKNELKSLEKEENEARIEIRRQSKQRIDALEEQKRAVEIEIAKHESLNASVWIMIPDVLNEIFQLYVDEGGSPWTITQVCPEWRKVAFDTSRLWSGITITSNVDEEVEVSRRVDGKEVCNSLPRLERALERVGNAPIDLDIILDWSYDPLGIDVVEAMLLAILERSSQWRSLYLQNAEVVVHADHIFALNLFQWSKRSFPALTRVELRMQAHNAFLGSRGLIPFIPLLEAIERTKSSSISLSPSSSAPFSSSSSSPSFLPLHSFHFHGCGKYIVKNSTQVRLEDGTIEMLTLIQGNPQKLAEPYAVLLEHIPANALVRRYLPLIPAVAADARAQSVLAEGQYIIEQQRRLSIHPSISLGLKDVQFQLDSLQALEIITTTGLDVSSPLHLGSLKRLIVYSPSLDGLQHFRTFKMQFLKIAQIISTASKKPTNPEDPEVVPPLDNEKLALTLVDLWSPNQVQAFNAEIVVLEGLAMPPGAITSILNQMESLRSLTLRNPRSMTSISMIQTFPAVLAELTQPHGKLDSVIVEYTSNSLVSEYQKQKVVDVLLTVVHSRRPKPLGCDEWSSVVLRNGAENIRVHALE